MPGRLRAAGLHDVDARERPRHPGQHATSMWGHNDRPRRRGRLPVPPTPKSRSNEAGPEEHCPGLVKCGPAVGITLLLATQRRTRSLCRPASPRTRRCVGASRSWARSRTTWSSAPAHTSAASARLPWRGRTRACARVVRSVYVDAPAADELAKRVYELRTQAGRLTGHALGEAPEPAASYDLLADVAAALPPGKAKAWSEDVITRLAELRPDVYGQWSPEQLAAAIKPVPIPPVLVGMLREHKKREGPAPDGRLFCAAGSGRVRSTGTPTSGRPPGRRRSPPRTRRRRSPTCPTPSATPASPCGSVPAWSRPRSPAAPVTAWPSSSASTPRSSRAARTRTTSAPRGLSPSEATSSLRPATCALTSINLVRKIFDSKESG